MRKIARGTETQTSAGTSCSAAAERSKMPAFRDYSLPTCPNLVPPRCTPVLNSATPFFGARARPWCPADIARALGAVEKSQFCYTSAICQFGFIPICASAAGIINTCLNCFPFFSSNSIYPCQFFSNASDHPSFS